MSATADPQKQFRTRANRSYRALLKERQDRGCIHDGVGKRYRVGVFYVLADNAERALEFYGWFAQEFPDDVGEPIADLYWAIAAYRSGDLAMARHRLQHAMLSNVYLLPWLFNEPLPELDIWHGSNWAEPGYLYDVEEYLSEPTDEERSWMKSEFHSDRFTRLREGYIEAFRALKHERDFAKRGAILSRWDRFAASFLKSA